MTERSEGHHVVEIFRDGLNDAEASELESQLIEAHGHHLVNWVNPGRQFDYPALEEYHTRREKNRAFVAETRLLERNDPELAVTRYRQALQEMDAYESLTTERGLVAELDGHRTFPDIAFLDRLTLCLTRLGRIEEARAEAERFFDRYPATREMSMSKAIERRVSRTTHKVAR